MLQSKLLWIFVCILMLTACGSKPELAANLPETAGQKNHADPIVDFQREVIPILEDTFSKHFPNKMNLSDTETVASYDGEALERLTDYYFNNEDLDNLKVVFLVHQEEAAEMKALRQELEQKLGDKVVFKKALFNANAVFEKIVGYTEKLEKQYSISVLSTGNGQTEINMRIRSYRDVEKKITADEIAAMKKTLTEYVGQPFPLEISIQECCSKSDAMSGEIEKVDTAGQRILIPGMWLYITDDALIVSGDQEISFDQLAVGQDVLAWTTGSMATSAPGLASAVKIQIK